MKVVETRGRPPKSKKSLIKKYRKNPSAWLLDTFGVELWEKQEKIVDSVWNNRFTAVKSCFASGKSYLAACLATSFVHLYKDSIVVTTAPSYRQLNNIWQPIHKIMENAKAPLGSDLLKHQIQCGPQHYAMGFTTNMPERLQGIHAKKILIIEDESAGIEEEIHNRLVDGLMTVEDAHLLAIGNPLSPEGHFYEMFSDPRYETFTISAFDTPNVKSGEEKIPGLITEEWVETQREKYGEGTPYWKSQVLGQFPPSSDEKLIPYTWAELAKERWKDKSPGNREVYGFDPSGGGLDEAALVTRAGSYVYPTRSWTGLNSQSLVQKIIENVQKNAKLYVDEVGVGWGVKGSLQEKGLYAIGVKGQASPEDGERFRNLRAELYWRLRRRLDPDGDDPLAIPADDDILFNQLTNIDYEIDTKGRIQIESKKKMKSKGKESPNRADALMLTMMDEYSSSTPMSVGVKEDMIDDLQKTDNFGYVSWQDYRY